MTVTYPASKNVEKRRKNRGHPGRVVECDMKRLLALQVVLWAVVGAATTTPAPGQEFDSFGLGDLGGGGLPAGDEVTVSAVPSHTEVAPGQTLHVALDVTIPDGWVYYSPDPGPIVKAGGIADQAPGLQVGPILWPQDKAKEYSLVDEIVVNNVYTGRAIIYVPLTVPPDAAAKTYDVINTVLR